MVAISELAAWFGMAAAQSFPTRLFQQCREATGVLELGALFVEQVMEVDADQQEVAVGLRPLTLVARRPDHIVVPSEQAAVARAAAGAGGDDGFI
ncbi:MAG TPA: hypothetical protein VFR83_09615 [Burkholderiales bacterium]|nr:hypothetical protein [Burkholderiales bacterium]